MRRASTSCASSPRASDSKRMSRARLRALDRDPLRGVAGDAGPFTSAAHTTQVAPVAGVDLDLRAGLEEQRDLDLGARRHRGRLGAAGRAVALQTRVGLGDLELDRGRELDVERRAVVEGDLHLLVLQEEPRLVADGRRGHGHLLVVRGVHEDEVVAVAVEVGHVAAVDVGGLDLGAGVEGLVDDLAGHHVLQRRADEGAALAGLDVLELGDGPEVAVDPQHEAVLQVVRRRHGAVLSYGSSQDSGTRSRGLCVRGTAPSSVTTSVSSIRTPPRPARYTPGSTVTVI